MYIIFVVVVPRQELYTRGEKLWWVTEASSHTPNKARRHKLNSGIIRDRDIINIM